MMITRKITLLIALVTLGSLAWAQEKTITVEVRQPKHKKVRVVLSLQTGKLLAAEPLSTFMGMWRPCDALPQTGPCRVARPAPVYRFSVKYVIQGNDLTYVAHEGGRITSPFTINAPFDYAVLDDSLYWVDHANKLHRLVIVEKILRDSAPNAAK